MKKGLLSILAGALLVVGCQNYDDQFDALESQINALASTVAGLSQVQSDLASLSATVGSLQGALQSGIDAALADGLADMIGFGRPFVANPDLPNRIKHGYPLNEHNPETLFGGGEKGLTDYAEYHAQ